MQRKNENESKGRERERQEEEEEEQRRKVSRGRELKSKTSKPQKTNVYDPCTTGYFFMMNVRKRNSILAHTSPRIKRRAFIGARLCLRKVDTVDWVYCSIECFALTGRHQLVAGR